MSTELTTTTGAPAMLRPVAQVASLAAIHDEISHTVGTILEDGRDYGVVPGTGSKPSLLKPGAERLAAAFGMAPSYKVVESEVDHDREVEWSTRRERGVSRGLYRYVVECMLTARATGEVVGSALGVCSTMESKYVRYPRDAENTALKMACKRALVAAVLNTLSLSERFTQDVEDFRSAPEPERRDVPPTERVYSDAPRRDDRPAGGDASPAKFGGTCVRCGDRYDEGDPIHFAKRDDGKWDRWHETCPQAQGDAPAQSDQDAVRLVRALSARLDEAPDRQSIRACGRDLHRALTAGLDAGRIRPDGETERDARAAMDRALLRREAMREAEAVRGPSQDDPWADDDGEEEA